MTKTNAERSQRHFMLKTKDFYHHHKSRARQAGHMALPFSLSELREICSQALGRPCPYCATTLDIRNLSLDHAIPVCRQGSWGLDNQVPCCKRCNQIKGPLDSLEFTSLLNLLRAWDPKAKANLLSRLYVSGKKVRFN
jgi:5-methylcytosine-specific restriction endonuclease McrA